MVHAEKRRGLFQAYDTYGRYMGEGCVFVYYVFLALPACFYNVRQDFGCCDSACSQQSSRRYSYHTYVESTVPLHRTTMVQEIPMPQTSPGTTALLKASCITERGSLLLCSEGCHPCLYATAVCPLGVPFNNALGGCSICEPVDPQITARQNKYKYVPGTYV